MLCHLCDTPRPKASKGPKAPPAEPSVRVRQPAPPPVAPGPRARRPPSPVAESQAPPQATQVPLGPHKDAEAKVRALRKDVSHLEGQVEFDPGHYQPLLDKAQGDLAAASEALKRAKPVASQLQACLSRKRQLEKSVAGLGAELEDLEDQVQEKRTEHEDAVRQLEEQETEFRRLTLLHQAAAPVAAHSCPTTAAVMALLTPELANSLLVTLSLLQSQVGASSSSSSLSGLVGEAVSKGGVPPSPSGGGTATPKAGQGTATPRVDVAGSSTPKARSRSPSARAETGEAGLRPGGFTIPGLVELQTVLAMVANRAALIPVDDDSMSTEL